MQHSRHTSTTHFEAAQDPSNYPKRYHLQMKKIPLDKYYIQERLDRELLVNTFWHSNTILVLKRAKNTFQL